MTNIQILSLNSKAQSSVIGWIIKSQEFAYKCKQFIKAEMFNDSYHQQIYTKTIEFLNEYKIVPSIESLSNIFYLNKEYTVFKQKIYDCEAQTKNFPLSYLSKEINTWIQLNIYKKSLHKSIEAYQKNQDEILKVVFNKTLEEISTVKFNGNLEYQFGNPIEDLELSNKQKQNSVTTGLKELDNLLGGGLFRGEHTVLIAPSNSGKTTVCINFVYHNIMQNKYCLFLTHEMTANTIVNRIRQRMLYKTYPDYLQMIANSQELEKELLLKCESRLIKYLTYIPYNKAGGIYVEDIVDIIKQKNIELFNKEGKYYDLIVDDYPGKLVSQTMKNYKEIRHSLRFVYEQFHQMALEFNCHAVSPVQTNRDGYKRNKNREKNDDFLGGEDIGEAFAIVQDADNAITINRSVEDQNSEVMTFFIDKTRSSSSRNALEVKTDFSRCISHDQRLQDNYLANKPKDENNTKKNLLDMLK